jgi:hypothetical protein
MADPAVKLVADVDGGTASFTFGGETFALPRKLDIRVVPALQRGDFDRALVLLLGAEQMERFLAVESDEPFDEHKLNELIEAVAAGSGTSVGESGASTSS